MFFPSFHLCFKCTMNGDPLSKLGSKILINDRTLISILVTSNSSESTDEEEYIEDDDSVSSSEQYHL